MGNEASGVVHVVRGTSGGAQVQAALESTGATARVVALRDPLEVGPLWDLEDGGARRLEFWDAVALPGEVDVTAEAEAWAAIRKAPTTTIWHGQHPGEYLLLLRAAAEAERMGKDLYEVKWRDEDGIADGRQPSIVGAPLARVVAHLPGERVTDLRALSEEWHRLTRSRESMFRRLEHGRLVDLPVTGYDERLLSSCQAGWTPIADVVVDLVANFPVGDRVVAWRIRALLEGGVLVGRGRGNYGFAEIRVAT